MCCIACRQEMIHYVHIGTALHFYQCHGCGRSDYLPYKKEYA